MCVCVFCNQNDFVYALCVDNVACRVPTVVCFFVFTWVDFKQQKCIRLIVAAEIVEKRQKKNLHIIAHLDIY